MIDSSGVLWMIVPEPKPIEPWPWTLIRTTVSHGLGLVGAGSGRSSVRLAVVGRVLRAGTVAHRTSAWVRVGAGPALSLALAAR